jgi:DNA polymerase-3 subunit epsilon
MNYCVIDTETSDLPENGGRIIELAWKIYNGKGQPLLETSSIVRPSGEWEMNPKDGRKSIHVFRRFMKDLLEYSENGIALVGHNISFDLEMLRNDYERVGLEGDLDFMPILCTQKLGKEFLGFRDTDKLSLDELHRKVVGGSVKGAHGALDDVNATAKCFFKMRLHNKEYEHQEDSWS